MLGSISFPYNSHSLVRSLNGSWPPGCGARKREGKSRRRCASYDDFPSLRPDEGFDLVYLLVLGLAEDLLLGRLSVELGLSVGSDPLGSGLVLVTHG